MQRSWDSALSRLTTRGRTLVGWAAAATLSLLFLAELLAPHDLTFGTLALIPIVVASVWLGPTPALAGIVAAAVAMRVVATVVGDIPIALAGLETLTYAAVAVLVSALSRRHGVHLVPEVVRIPVPHNEGSDRLAFRGAPRLTPREQEVVAMAMRGMTAGRIAERLTISRRTVETHLSRAYDKLGVHSKQDLIEIAHDQLPREAVKVEG